MFEMWAAGRRTTREPGMPSARRALCVSHGIGTSRSPAMMRVGGRMSRSVSLAFQSRIAAQPPAYPCGSVASSVWRAHATRGGLRCSVSGEKKRDMAASPIEAIPFSSTFRRRCSIKSASGLGDVFASTRCVTRSAACTPSH